MVFSNFVVLFMNFVVKKKGGSNLWNFLVLMNFFDPNILIFGVPLWDFVVIYKFLWQILKYQKKQTNFCDSKYIQKYPTLILGMFILTLSKFNKFLLSFFSMFKHLKLSKISWKPNLNNPVLNSFTRTTWGLGNPTNRNYNIVVHSCITMV